MKTRNRAIQFSLNDGVVPDPHALAEQDHTAAVIEDPGVDPLKYATPATATAAALGLATDEIATVKLRYKQPDGDTSQLIEAVARDDGRTLAETHEDFQFASAVASFGMLLRGSPYASGWTLPPSPNLRPTPSVWTKKAIAASSSSLSTRRSR